MKTQDDWIRLTNPAVSWRERYPEIDQEVRLTLADVPQGDTLTTKGLVDRMFPDPRGMDGGHALVRLYKALEAISDHSLVDAWVKGKAVVRYGKPAYPKLWHHVDAPATIPDNADPAENAYATQEEIDMVANAGRLSDVCEIADHPLVSRGDVGVWVQAWVFAPWPTQEAIE